MDRTSKEFLLDGAKESVFSVITFSCTRNMVHLLRFMQPKRCHQKRKRKRKSSSVIKERGSSFGTAAAIYEDGKWHWHMHQHLATSDHNVLFVFRQSYKIRRALLFEGKS